MKRCFLLILTVVWICMVSHAVGAERSNLVGHWAFKELAKPIIPSTNLKTWPRTALDQFILARLEKENLTPSPEASRIEVMRRLYLTVTGLPPSPEQAAAFLSDESEDAYDRLVDQLLASPHYGERWAQFWLDVIRYADTDGFEVNTERKNAWPYRDYVIRAFNADTPYDQFIKEQLAGDAFNEDAATGFLVTAAALLPGQIGADDVSKRQARQDALDEMILNTSEAFLGLSIACARCHDHKFDPISQRDYYAMQAFFAGVEYGERPISSAASKANRERSDELKSTMADLQNSLRQYEPLARLGPPVKVTHAKLNEETFTPVQARYVRFTIHDANRHPALGLIEPCIDEFEIFPSGLNPTNLALATSGGRVTASGSRASENHQLEFVNDGRYGNSRSWMSDQAGQGSLLFELSEPREIAKIIWSRDREGNFQDRLPIAYSIEAGLSLESMTQVAFVPPGRPPVNAKLNTDRFAPVTANALRFTISAATSLEPCIDELEVFATGAEPKNIALASGGTKASASGTIPGSDIHKLEHLNDGLYGNGRSWISSEKSRGWVELKFAVPQNIDRVLWGRDREEKFADRLATEYQIEVQGTNGEWQMVASSADRRPYGLNENPGAVYSFADLSKEEAKRAGALLQKLKIVEKEIALLTPTPVVFAGLFRKPGTTRLLNRGDPEQPQDEISPAAPAVLKGAKLSSGAAEQARRLALANWIASPDNPLTARVMVNRIWQAHFGIGLVETPSDFGLAGRKPSHPELLDWLANEFVRSGWSMKKLHKMILTSATFRQSSRGDGALLSLDADTRLLWRFPPRRLEAEALRDSILAVSGRLNTRGGGPGFNLFTSRGGLNGFPPIENFAPDGLRRMIYAHKVRMEPDPVFAAFDCPDAGQTRPRRRQSTTPLQALNLFNSRFTLTEADAFASRVKREARSMEDNAIIHRAWLLAFSRAPEKVEAEDAESFLREHGLPALCRVIFNSNEFLFVP